MNDVIAALDQLRRETDSPRAVAIELARDRVVRCAVEWVKTADYYARLRLNIAVEELERINAPQA